MSRTYPAMIFPNRPFGPTPQPEEVGSSTKGVRPGLRLNGISGLKAVRGCVSRCCFSLVLLWGAVCSGALGDDKSVDLTGHWEGAIETGSHALKITLDFEQDKNGWTGKIGIPAQGLKGFSLGKVQIAEEEIFFEMPGVQGYPSFKGRLSEDGRVMTGDFAQGVVMLKFSVKRMSEAELAEARKKLAQRRIESTWEGTLATGSVPLLLVLTVYRESDGSLSAKLDSPTQGAMDLEVSGISFSNGEVRLELPFINASFSGKVSADGSEMTGAFVQLGRSLPLTWKRVRRNKAPVNL